MILIKRKLYHFQPYVCFPASSFNKVFNAKVYPTYFLYQERGAFEFASGGYINDTLLIERLYLGLFCTISIIISVREIDRGYSAFNKWYFSNIVLCTLFVLLISSRMAIASILIVFILRFFYTKRIKLQLVFALGLLLVLITSLALNNSLKERIFFTQNNKTNLS